MFWLIFIAFIVLCLGVIVAFKDRLPLPSPEIKANPKPQNEDYSYGKNIIGLFTPCELNFYRALVKAVDGKAKIFGKVRVADVLVARQGKRSKQAALQKITQKHFDFVLCDSYAPPPCSAIFMHLFGFLFLTQIFTWHYNAKDN